MKVPRWSVVLLTCAVGAFGVAACGDDDDDGGGGSTGAAASTSAATTEQPEGGPSQATIDLALKYTGGKAGAATGDPITIGFIDEAGVPAFPEHQAAATATLKLINEQLGGIAGRPLQLQKCTVQTEEDGQKCGAELTSGDLPLINVSLLVVGNTSLAKTVAQKVPMLFSITPGAADITTKGSYSFNGGGFAVLGAMAEDLVKNGAKNIASVTVGNPGGKFSWEDQTKPKLDKLGVKYKNVYFKDDATTPDMVSALQAAGGSTADAIYINPSGPANCLSLYEAMKQLNIQKPVAATPICNAPAFIDQTGAGPDGWRIWGFGQNPRVTDDTEVQAYLDTMKAYGQEKFQFVGFADATWRDLLTIAKFGNEIGADNITNDTFTDAILKFRGPVPMVPGEQNCETPPDKNFPGLCGNAAVGSTYADGKWSSLGDIVIEPTGS